MGTGAKKLQIKLLSRSGELLNVVNCFAGRITVLRAASDSELGPYQRGLAGIGGPEHLVINVDGTPYQPDDHVLIGFGQSFLENNCTVHEYLLASGAPAGAVETILVSYGLDRKGSVFCSQLTADEARRLELLAAVNSSGKVLVINAPFEPIASSWRERFAELLSSFAVQKEQIVVIPKLVYRPESWIDNEFIARVQVGQNLQRTIGFGSAPSNVNDIIKEVRNLLKDDDAANALLEKMQRAKGGAAQPINFGTPHMEHDRGRAAPDSHGRISAAKPRHRRSEPMGDMLQTPRRDGGSRFAAALLSLVVIFGRASRAAAEQFMSLSLPLRVAAIGAVAVLAVHLSTQSDQAADRQMPTAQSNTDKDIGSREQAASQAAAPREEDISTEDEQQRDLQPAGEERAPSNFVLDRYPAPLKQSVVAAFNGELPQSSEIAAVSYPLVSSPKDPLPSDSTKKTNLFALLEAASNTGEDTPDQEFRHQPPLPGQPPVLYQPSHSGDVDEQRKREIIHQKFLEAIRKASERRQMNSGF